MTRQVAGRTEPAGTHLRAGGWRRHSFAFGKVWGKRGAGENLQISFAAYMLEDLAAPKEYDTHVLRAQRDDTSVAKFMKT